MGCRELLQISSDYLCHWRKESLKVLVKTWTSLEEVQSEENKSQDRAWERWKESQ